MWNKNDDVSYGGALQKFRKMKCYPSPLIQTEFNMLLTVFVSETGSILFIVDVFFFPVCCTGLIISSTLNFYYDCNDSFLTTIEVKTSAKEVCVCARAPTYLD